MPGPRRLAFLVAVAFSTLVAVAGASCSGDDPSDSSRDDAPAAGDTTTAPPDGPTADDLCDGAVHDTAAVAVASVDLTETSGLAASRRFDGVLWAHNDSGGAAEVFAIGPDGADLGRYPVEGAEAEDWEDMALATGPDGGDVLYLGDIGDNDSARPSITVYRAPGPAAAPDGAGGSLIAHDALTLTYADGPRDAETLLADPVTGDLFVVSKQWDLGPTGVYRVPAEAAPGAPVAMERAADVTLPSLDLVTGGDVSADGSLVALRTYGGVLLWDRAPGQTVPEALAAQPCSAPVVAEAQGEAVAFSPDGRGYVTISEGQNPVINRFALA